MFSNLLFGITLAGAALGTGATVSAGGYAHRAEVPPPTIAPIDGYAAPERQPVVAPYTVTCISSTACSSLRAWCDKHDGTYTEFVDGNGETKGMCSG